MNRSNLRIAIVGASGAVGREFLRVMEQRKTGAGHVALFASARSAGESIPFRGTQLPVKPLDLDAVDRGGVFKEFDVVLLSAGATVSRRAVPAAIRDGALAIDNSSAFREDPSIPLVVPEINGQRIADHKGVVANPNCTAAILLMAVAPIHRAAMVRRIIVTSFQAVSGKGARAMEECITQSRELLTSAALDRTMLKKPAVFTKQIAFNVIPHIDEFEADGRTREEIKVENESRKILEHDTLHVEATCVRVPVLRCHSESVTVELDRPLSPEEARGLWRDAPGVRLMDDPKGGGYPTPVDVEGQDDVFVGRVRRSRVFTNGLAFWCVGDQLRKGAALNAIQILESAAV